MTPRDEPTRRERRRQFTIEEILATARRQMAAEGAAALSLRGIAREMELTAPALYRYFKSRDDLVTALIIAAYNSLADALEAARDACPGGDDTGRLFAGCVAYRAWALAHPEDYALIFGTPLAGYHAPMEQTLPAAKRSMDILVDLIQAAQDAGRLKPDPAYSKPPPSLQRQLAKWRKDYAYTAYTPALYLALVGWSRMHGLILLELFHHVQPFFGDLDELYKAEIRVLFNQAGLQVSRST